MYILIIYYTPEYRSLYRIYSGVYTLYIYSYTEGVERSATKMELSESGFCCVGRRCLLLYCVLQYVSGEGVPLGLVL